MNRKLCRPNRDRTGATSVEFVFVFPIILFFFIAMVVMTQAFLLKDMTQHAAYEGARAGILYNATARDARTAAEDYMKMMNMKGVQVSSVPLTITNTTREITISVTVPMNENAWIAAPFMPPNWTIGSEVTLAKRLD